MSKEKVETKSVCPYCGREFDNWNGQMIYCSKSCREHDFRLKNPTYDKEYRRKKNPVYYKKCRNCNKEFQTTNDKMVFCSKECKIKHHNSARPTTKHEMRICPVCGKTFRAMQKSGVGRTYCTPECRNKFYNGRRRIPNKAKDWESRKKNKWDGNWYKALSRDNFTCQICNIKRRPCDPTTKKRFVLEVHHKDGSGETENKNHELDNLITLCNKCHRLFHGLHLIKIEEEYFIKGDIFNILNITSIKTKF